MPDASPGQAAAPRDRRRRRLPGMLLVLEELVLPQLRWVVLILPPQMLGGFEPPATVAAAAAGHRGQAAAALCLHAAGGRAAPGGQGRRLPPSCGQQRGNCAEKLDSSCRATPRPSVGAAGAAAPAGLECSAGGEAGRGGGEEEERRGWHPARKYLKPGWSPGGGEQSCLGAVVGEQRAVGCAGGGRDETRIAGRARKWDRERMRRGSVPLMLQPSSPESVAAVPPEGLPAGRWQVAKLLTPLFTENFEVG